MKKIPILCAWVVIIISFFVMAGWFLDIDALKQIVPGFVTMKFSTALSFFLSGLILLYSYELEFSNSKYAEIVIPAATLTIILFMGTVLISLLFGFVSGIERLFVVEDVGAAMTAIPGRPSIGTVVAFILVAVLGITALSGLRKHLLIYYYIGLALSILGISALVGYMTSQPILFYKIGDISTAMAIHTAILFFILGIGYVYMFRYINLLHKSFNKDHQNEA